jgi:hypothetical protein
MMDIREWTSHPDFMERTETGPQYESQSGRAVQGLAAIGVGARRLH